MSASEPGGRGGPLRALFFAVRARIVYRTDSLLSTNPLAQVVVILGLTACVVGAWAALLSWAEPGPPRPGADAMWWSVTRFFDGGTMASDSGVTRIVALGVTTSGVLLMSFLTAAFASKMGERLRDLRAGSSVVAERGHMLILGFDPKVALIAKQFAMSGQKLTLVVLALEDKARIEQVLSPAKRDARGRLHVVVRTGDPRREQSLLRVAAEHARGVIVIAPSSLDDEGSVRWLLSTLLALRKVMPPRFAGRVTVEVRHAAARELLMLATERDVAGPGALDVEIVASDEVIAKTLAHSVRQDGLYFTVRRLLTFDACELYVDDVPGALDGLTFDEAHARIRGGILVGIHRGRGSIVLSPEPGASLRITRNDKVIVMAPGTRKYSLDGALPEAIVRAKSSHVPPPEEIVVLGHSGTLPHLLAELDRTLPPYSRVRLVHGGMSAASRHELRALAKTATRITVDLDRRRAMQVVRDPDSGICASTGVVILGREGDDEEADDAASIATLLWLRHGLRARGVTGRKRIVTEVRDPRAAASVANLDHDILVSSDLVAMLLAQDALDPDVAPVYAELLSPHGIELLLHPRADYLEAGASSASGTFADVMVAARAYGEVALGIYEFHPSVPGVVVRRPTLELNPARDFVVPGGEHVQVVVLGPRARV